MQSVVRLLAAGIILALLGGVPPLAQTTLAAGPAGAAAPATNHIFVPFAAKAGQAQDVARAFNSNQSGVVSSGGGHILGVGPRSVPDYQDGAPATLTLSVDVAASPPVPPPDWLRIVSPPATFGPEDFTFNFPLSVRMPVAGVRDLSNLFMLHLNENGEWTRSLFSFNADPPTALETTLFNLGTMAVGEYDGASAAALHAQGGVWLPNVRCPIGGMDCFYYLTIQSFVPKYPDEVPAGIFNGTTLRVHPNVTGESPIPSGWLLPQGRYTFCYSALESPLTLTNLRKFINPNPEVVVVDKPYACSLTFTCKTEVHPINREGWIEAVDDRPCQMGIGVSPSDPAILGRTGDFQATLRWTNDTNSFADLDLHLYGPDGLHVEYGAKVSADGSLRLDRDWRSTVGDAVENIYQVKDDSGKSIPMPKGSYRLEVDHYSGATKSYQVRVILNGSVRNFNGTIAYPNQIEIMTFTVQ